MSNIDKRALREELSNPAIGSNAHLRKLALALLDELEAAERRNSDQSSIIAKQEKWIKDVEATMISATDRAEAAEKRIAELERERIAMEAVTLAMRDDMRAAAGKGE
jgi:hypothetical protein